MRILAVDPGGRRVGLAICDGLGLTVRPLMTIDRKKSRDFLGQIVGLVQKESVERVLVGVPVQAEGHLGPAAQRSLRIIDRLKERLEEAKLAMDVVGVDESFTSTEAHSRLRERGIPTAEHRTIIDQEAAAVLLEGYLRDQGAGH